MMWERLWDQLNDALVDLGAGLAADHPGVRWSVNADTHPHAPLRAYLQYTYDAALGEDAVDVTLDVYRKDDHLEWTADISFDTSGQVLAEGPGGSIEASGDVEAWAAALLRDTVTFFTAHRGLLDVEITKMKTRQLGPQSAPGPPSAHGA